MNRLFMSTLGGMLISGLALGAGLRRLRDLGWTLPPVRSAQVDARGG